MKRSHIIAIVIIAVAVAMLMGSLGDSSTYANVAQAAAQPGEEFHVVGTLDRSQPVVYEPNVNASLTEFAINDLEGRNCRVKLAMPKPNDLDRSERVVLIGSMGDDGTFHAKKMLLKCPSKYNEENRIDRVGTLGPLNSRQKAVGRTQRDPRLPSAFCLLPTFSLFR